MRAAFHDDAYSRGVFSRVSYFNEAFQTAHPVLGARE
tara:strand:- start:1 stop:111 length:111 start_codon:yes stop_codon:yes gene_type:complete